jgi:uncharacterized membrane protein
MKKITIVALVASIIGFIDSAYLVYVKLSHAIIYCTPGLGDCATVQSSQWSTIWGIPIAIFGAIAYLSLIGLYLFEKKIKILSKYSDYLIFGISFFGFVYSMFLTYLEFFVIHALCQWCVLSALFMTLIFITTIVRLKDLQTRPNN